MGFFTHGRKEHHYTITLPIRYAEVEVAVYGYYDYDEGYHDISSIERAESHRGSYKLPKRVLAYLQSEDMIEVFHDAAQASV
jgi:hypothetical protein